MKVKKYKITVTAKGGLWVGQRRKYEIEVEGENRNQACEKALNIAEKELRGQEDYDSIHAK